MDEKQLKTGIAMLYDMELNHYVVANSIAALNKKISSLGQKRNYSKPIGRKVSVDHETKVSTLLASTLFGWLIGFLIGALSGCSGGSIEDAIGGTIIGMIFGAVFGYGIGCLIVDGKQNTLQNEEDARYRRELDSYEMALALDDLRVDNEILEKQILERERKVLLERKKSSDKLRMELYSKLEIDNNYRSLVAIGYMNEFIRLGIATTLDGVNGLYYLVRREIRLDIFQLTVEEISQKLDTIIDNQSQLYYELKGMNQKCEQLVYAVMHMAETSVKNAESLEMIKRNSEIAAYNSERIARENEYQSFLMTWKH